MQNGSQTVLDVVTIYLANIERRIERGDLTPAVGDTYCSDLADFCKQFGDRPVSQLRQHDLTEFLAAHPKWKAVNTKRRAVSSVLSCFRWARDEEIIPTCPYSSPRALRGMIAETRRPATHDEFRTLLEWARPEVKWALLFLYRTGCRTCEMRELTWDSCRLVGKNPHLVLAKHKTVRRTGRPRIVGLDMLTVRLLLALKRISKSDRVFVNADGNPWLKDSFCHHIRRLAARIGLDCGVERRVSAYCLRHTYACDAIEAGFGSSQVAHALGHSSAAMVEGVYARHVGQRVAFISDVATGISRDRK